MTSKSTLNKNLAGLAVAALVLLAAGLYGLAAGQLEVLRQATLTAWAIVLSILAYFVFRGILTRYGQRIQATLRFPCGETRATIGHAGLGFLAFPKESCAECPTHGQCPSTKGLKPERLTQPELRAQGRAEGGEE